VPDALDKVSGLNLATVEIGTFDYPKGSVDSAYRTLGKLTGKPGLKFTIDFFKRETQMFFARHHKQYVKPILMYSSSIKFPHQ
jgi:hypothetical protein